jgi:hypothetical protein
MNQEQIDFESLNDDIPEKCHKCGRIVTLLHYDPQTGCFDCLPFEDDAKIYPPLKKEDEDARA